MSLIKSSWRGEKNLAIVFWGYYVAFYISYLFSFGFLVSLTPEDLKLFIIVPGILFFFPYTVWVLVSIWRCAKNSKPIWKVLARIWVVIVVVGGTGRLTASYLENYKYYSEKAKASEIKLMVNNSSSNTQGWRQDQLTESYMRSITKDMCVTKTAITIDKCKAQQCFRTMGGVLGDCITFSKGNLSNFCKTFETKYLNRYCSDTDNKNIKCKFFEPITSIFCK